MTQRKLIRTFEDVHSKKTLELLIKAEITVNKVNGRKIVAMAARYSML